MWLLSCRMAERRRIPRNPPWVGKSEGAVRPARETICRSRKNWGVVITVIEMLNVNVWWPLGDIYLSFLVDSRRSPAQPGLCLASPNSRCAEGSPCQSKCGSPHLQNQHVGEDTEVLEMHILERYSGLRFWQAPQVILTARFWEALSGGNG